MQPLLHPFRTYLHTPTKPFAEKASQSEVGKNKSELEGPGAELVYLMNFKFNLISHDLTRGHQMAEREKWFRPLGSGG